MSLLHPIHHTFGPHINWNYFLRTVGLFFTPWKWRRGKETDLLKETLAEKFHANTFLFASGRESLLALLRALNLQSGEEVIVQGYTCIAVPNAIHAASGVPVYVDIEKDTLNLDPEEVERAITHRTRAVICQHTFGIPSDTDRLRDICDANNLLFIEDCAHIIPDETGPQSIGQKGDAIILSFGRDKAISGIAGGAVLVRRDDLADELKKEEENTTNHSLWYIARLLTYPIAYFKARPVYGLFVGKASLYFLKKIGSLIPVVSTEEKEGKVSPILHRIPNACAFLALHQLQQLDRINDHRRTLTRFYLEEAKKHEWEILSGIRSDLPLQKFPLFIRGADAIRDSLKKKNIHLDDGWTGCVVCPASVNMAATNYEPGSDPEAEAAAEMILSLPTHPTMTLKQAQNLVNELSPLLQSHS